MTGNRDTSKVPVDHDGNGDENYGGDGLSVDDEDHGAHTSGEQRLGPQRHSRVDALCQHHGRRRRVILHGCCTHSNLDRGTS